MRPFVTCTPVKFTEVSEEHSASIFRGPKSKSKKKQYTFSMTLKKEVVYSPEASVRRIFHRYENYQIYEGVEKNSPQPGIESRPSSPSLYRLSYTGSLTVT
jgi:hypothetical protein